MGGQQICHVRATPDAPPQELDLNRAEDEQFPAEKLRMTVERFYTSVVVGAVGFWSHVARLRSWKEPRRTSVFCAVSTTYALRERIIGPMCRADDP